MNRIIGEYGEYNSGKLYIILAAIHGNELAGVKAMEQIFNYFTKEKISFQGKIIALRGNVTAIENQQRFIHKDLNRQWYNAKIKKLSALPFGMLNTSEDKEQVKLLEAIQQILAQQEDKNNIFLMDLHTTSAQGACMTITNQHAQSVQFARMLPVPVIDKMTTILTGTTLEYFENMQIPGIAYEAGQHDAPQSIKRMKYGIMSLLLKSNAIDRKYENIFAEGIEKLRKYNEGLPYVVEVSYRHAIEEEDEFVMQAGYTNFQTIKKDELLAHDKNGEIRSPHNGMILMPLYQKKGNDGFFIVQKK